MKRSGVRRQLATKKSRRIKKINKVKQVVHDKVQIKGLNTTLIPIVQQTKDPVVTMQIQPQYASVEELLRLRGDKKDKIRLNSQEQQIARKLISKYRDNFVQWAKDVKDNKMQWTAKQCQRIYKMLEAKGL